MPTRAAPILTLLITALATAGVATQPPSHPTGSAEPSRHTPRAPVVTPDDLFTLHGRPAQHAIATAPWAGIPQGPIPDSPMLRELAGIAAELTARDIRDLARSIEPQTRLDGPAPRAAESWSLHLALRRDDPPARRRTITIHRTPEGWPYAESEGTRVRLDTAAFDRLSQTWQPTRPAPASARTANDAHDPDTATGALNDPHPSRGVQLAPVPAPIRLDAPELASRFAAGGPNPFAGTLTRTIDRESFALYPPPEASPSPDPETGPETDPESDPDAGPRSDTDQGPRSPRPVGLVVWINPTESAAAPRALLEAAAGLNLAVAVPANAGNDRPIIDRLQLALDTAASADRAIWIDHERLYIAGLSGGGRLASMLWAAAPDRFTGALCVVGINSHHAIPTGDGNAWPASHAPPRGDLARALRPHPIAAISGPRDFNFHESKRRAEALARDGYPARLFDIEGLAHTMPDAADLAAALRWIERPVTERREHAATQAQTLLDQIPEDRLTIPPADPTPRERRILERITEIAPWTDPAWHAAELLGYVTAPSP